MTHNSSNKNSIVHASYFKKSPGPKFTKICTMELHCLINVHNPARSIVDSILQSL